MIKIIGFLIVCFATIGLNAQDGSVSPYSFFGIGDSRTTATVENQMMGGIGIYADSIHVNLQNPAAYGKLKLMVYSGGLSYERLSLSSDIGDESNQIANLEYIALGFNIGKNLGLGFGIKPLTSVGYSITSDTFDSNDAEVSNVYTGAGGVNKFYLSLGYQLTKSLAVGVTGNVNFGNIDTERSQEVEDIQFATFDIRNSRINGLNFNYSLNYTPTINEKYTLRTSVRVNTKATLSSRNTQSIGSFEILTNQSMEEFEVDLEAQGLKDTTIEIPTTTTFGLGYGEDRKWFLGGEYSFQALSGYSNVFSDVNNVIYQDASSIAFGGFFIPDYLSYNSYFKRVTYRAGVRMENTGLVVNDTEINNFGITFGVGLPLSTAAGGFSNVNLGFEIGKRGTTEMLLVEESYFKLNLGLSLNDRWFLKRKIN